MTPGAELTENHSTNNEGSSDGIWDKDKDKDGDKDKQKQKQRCRHRNTKPSSSSSTNKKTLNQQ